MTGKLAKIPTALKIELMAMTVLLVAFLCLLVGTLRAGETETEGAEAQAETLAEDAAPAPAATEEPYMEYGTETGPEISTAGFIAPDSKNNLDLVEYVNQAWIHQWGYVWGTFGDVLTEELLDFKLRQYPDDIGEYLDFIEENWLGRRTADCVGLIKSYGWFDPHGGSIDYGTNGMADCDTEDMFEAATEKGTIDTMPEIPGLIVYYEGHTGVYIGGGYVIEAQGTETGVVKTKLSQRPFTHWMKCPYIFYYKQETPPAVG